MTIILMKQLILAILEGTIPFYILFYFESKKSPSNVVKSMLANDNIQIYLIILVAIYIVLWFIDNYVFIPTPSLKKSVIFFKDIFNQVASSIKSIFRIFVGIVIGFLLIWKKIEPQTLSFGRVCGLLFLAIIFLCVVSGLEQMHTLMEKRTN